MPGGEQRLATRALRRHRGAEHVHEPVDVRAVVRRCQEQGVNPGLALSRLGLDEQGLLVAITEQRSRADIDRLADVLGAAVAAERQAAEVTA